MEESTTINEIKGTPSYISPEIWNNAEDSLSLIEIGTFSNYSLTHITIPSSATSIGDYAFRFCSSLTQITFPSFMTYIEQSMDAHTMKNTYIKFMVFIVAITSKKKIIIQAEK